MKNPKVSLAINVNADTHNALYFVDCNKSEFIKKFVPKDFQFILSNKFSKKERDKIIRECTRYIFETHKKEIQEGVRQAEKDWLLIEKKYFKLINELFRNHLWPKGEYIGYVSIYNMFPRNIKNKTFYFPYKHRIKKFSNSVIAHELLHFIFFDYIEEKYGLNEKSKIKSKNEDYVWQVSEVFNAVIENWSPYYKIFKHKKPPYTGKEMYKKMSRQWARKQDLDWLLDQWLKI